MVFEEAEEICWGLVFCMVTCLLLVTVSGILGTEDGRRAWEYAIKY